MSVLNRLVRATRSWRASSSHDTLGSARVPPRDLRSLHGHQIQLPNLGTHAFGSSSMLKSVLISLLGIGIIETAYADRQKDTVQSPIPPKALSSNGDLEETAKKDRIRIEELLRSKGIQEGSYPQFTVAVKGSKVAIKFQVPPACEVARLVASLVSKLGLKVEERDDGSDMSVRAWDSAVGWQLVLNPPAKEKDALGPQGHSPYMSNHKENLCIIVFRSLISTDKVEIAFFKQGSLTDVELEALVSVLQLAGMKLGQDQGMESRSKEGSARMPSAEKTIADLESMGVVVYGNPASKEGEIDWNTFPGHDKQKFKEGDIAWNTIAGYEQQKREIEDTILIALRNPETYDDIAHGTRKKFEPNRPRAVLFEGPPGTGKTSSARFIANQAGVPLVYVPLEAIMSKWYGETTRSLGKIFSLANNLPDGAIIFLDEIDSFAGIRNSVMHEATRRILSILLQQIDGFQQDKKVIVIAATNRKQDLDPALMSRFDTIIRFGLPDEQSRTEIAAQYAKHLTRAEMVKLAQAMQGMSGRDIREVCQQAERSWASKIIRGQVERGSFPPLQEYIEKARTRWKTS